MKRLFDCVICQREVVDYDNTVRNGRDRHLSPICKSCEGHYSDKPPTHGAFMDRRVAKRLSAIANALRGTAGCMEFEARYGRS
jgi:hypothetical protein